MARQIWLSSSALTVRVHLDGVDLAAGARGGVVARGPDGVDLAAGAHGGGGGAGEGARGD